MKTKPIRLVWRAGVVFMSLVPLTAICASTPDTWYVGAKAGWVSATGACEPHATSCSNDTASAGLFVGYILNDWLALEAGYDYLGEIKADYPALGHPADSAQYKAKMQGIELVAKPYWQVNDHFSWFGKAGTLIWDMKVTGDEVGFTHEASDNDLSLLLGTGVEYAFNRYWSALLEYQWVNNVGGHDTGGTDLNMVNLGVSYRFASTNPPVPTALAFDTTTPAQGNM